MGARGPFPAGEKTEHVAYRGNRARLHHWLRLEGIQKNRQMQRHLAAARHAGDGEVPGAALHAVHQGRRRRARREHRLRKNDRDSRQRKTRRSGSRPEHLDLQPRGRLRPQKRHHPRRHQARVRPRPRNRKTRTSRRGANPRLLSLCKRRGLRGWQAACVDGQAIRPRLGS